MSLLHPHFFHLIFALIVKGKTMETWLSCIFPKLSLSALFCYCWHRLSLESSKRSCSDQKVFVMLVLHNTYSMMILKCRKIWVTRGIWNCAESFKIVCDIKTLMLHISITCTLCKIFTVNFHLLLIYDIITRIYSFNNMELKFLTIEKQIEFFLHFFRK